MQSTLPETTTRASLASMVGIEARRFARHPLFLIGVGLAYAVTIFVMLDPGTKAVSGPRHPDSILAWTIIPAFFIGLTSLIVAARLTRSTEVSIEAVGSAPGSEAKRTLAVAAACVVPLAAGLVWLVGLLIGVRVLGHYPQELWFGTLPAMDVWATLLAGGVVSCLGGALLGVLVGRWLRFPGAPVVAVVVLVAVVMIGQMPFAYDSGSSRLRLYLPWVMFHTGTMSEESYQGIGQNQQAFLPGNPGFYLLYVLGLCALAVGAAVWHDRASRTSALRTWLLALVAFCAVTLALAILTGNQQFVLSEPLPIAWS